MGNVLDSKPQKYSDQQFHPTTYGGVAGYMATYHQDDAAADHMQYGQTQLQFGVKILQDVDPGPQQGELYVTNTSGKRLYITHEGQVAPYAADYLKQAKDYGNGPAVMITGTPTNPQYHMFTVAGGDYHAQGVSWEPVPVNNEKDIVSAMTEGGVASKIHGKYANMYGNASINPWGVKAGSDMFTTGQAVGNFLNKAIGTFAVPALDSVADDFVPGGSQIMHYSGADKLLQAGINALAKQPDVTEPPSAFDPNMANIIKDPRLPQYLQNIQNQSQQYAHKYGARDYQQAMAMPSGNPQQMLAKAKELQQENEDLYVQGQVSEMQNTSQQLQKLLPNADPQIFKDIETGLQTARNNQQKLNVIKHFSAQIQSQLLPLLQPAAPSADSGAQSASAKPSDPGFITASAQVGHPVLSINGTDSRHPGQNTISGSSAV